MSNFDCCLLLNAQERNYPKMLKSMLPAMQSAHFTSEIKSTNVVDRPVAQEDTSNRTRSPLGHLSLNPRIVNCAEDGKVANEFSCQAFSKVLSNLGLAYGHNLPQVYLQ